MNQRMIAGEVVRIRVNPRDCMRVVDVINKAKVYTRGMSFSQAVSLVLSSLLESAQQSKMIPERDGFEFSEMMQQFGGVQRHKRKVEITRAVQSIGSDIRVPTLRPAEFIDDTPPVILRLNRKLAELVAKQEAAPESWGPEDDKALQQLTEELARENERWRAEQQSG